MDTHTDLSGKRILLAGDDYGLARQMAGCLRDLGATVIGPAPTLKYARRLLARQPLDGALLDITLHGEESYPLARQLQDSGVPVIFVTGAKTLEIPPAFRDVPHLSAPLERTHLIEIVARFDGRSRRHPGARPNGDGKVAATANPDAQHRRRARWTLALARALRPLD